jgi:hypothetical protein
LQGSEKNLIPLQKPLPLEKAGRRTFAVAAGLGPSDCVLQLQVIVKTKTEVTVYAG